MFGRSEKIDFFRRRLGSLSDAQVAQIRQLSVPQLESLGEALLDFTAMADLEMFLSGEV
jgi:hypothetical protein